VTLPGSVTTVGTQAFFECISLTSVTAGWETPLSIEGDPFYGVPLSSCTLHVPAGTKALYEAAAGRKDFGTIME
jgi:hypothetical protein